jgi:hypothetical protein
MPITLIGRNNLRGILQYVESERLQQQTFPVIRFLRRRIRRWRARLAAIVCRSKGVLSRMFLLPGALQTEPGDSGSSLHAVSSTSATSRLPAATSGRCARPHIGRIRINKATSTRNIVCFHPDIFASQVVFSRAAAASQERKHIGLDLDARFESRAFPPLLVPLEC